MRAEGSRVYFFAPCVTQDLLAFSHLTNQSFHIVEIQYIFSEIAAQPERGKKR